MRRGEAGRAGRGVEDDLSERRAHWLTRDVIAVPDAQPDDISLLHLAAGGGLQIHRRSVRGGAAVPLRWMSATLPDELAQRHPHLASYAALRVPRQVDVKAALRGQVAVSSSAGRHGLVTGVQIPGVLDDLYADPARTVPLGVSFREGRPTIAVWAPTARRIRLQRFTTARSRRPVAIHEMAIDARSGVWSLTGQRGWYRQYYRYEVEVFVPTSGRVERNLVTDPYAVSLSAGSDRVQIVDLRDPELQPDGWDGVTTSGRPPVALAVYELHVRDFSIADRTVRKRLRGKYLAFTEPHGAGAAHLRRLAADGLTTIHLLPTFDVATLRPAGGFNWGYDPLHYSVPEGSYATEPDGPARIVEYRRMVQALKRAGLDVVSDVVFNHTHAAGQDRTSVLDRIVPGYYHRLLEDGSVATSTCCPNTATEHAMMERLMIDSVVTWATAYRVDGFRFDLMGHHSTANLRAVRTALDALTPDGDGVDGAGVCLYGEGWDFGEAAGDARFPQATQRSLAGTGVGTFNDRLRDAVRGGAPFDADPRVQGFATGLAGDPNGAACNGDPEEQRATLLRYADQIRVGLAGNLADYAFVDRHGERVTGAAVPYGDEPTGYTADPSENVLYVSAHDNETLYDALVWKLPTDTPMDVRIRMQLVALSFVALGQGVSFFHAGCDLLRSKSLDRNSYDSGDRFNALDWSGRTTNFGVGVPPGPDNEPWRDLMGPLLKRRSLRPRRADVAATGAGFRDLLRLARSTPLFALGTAHLIHEKLGFLNTGPDQIPGLIAMVLDDTVGDDVDQALDRVIVFFNAAPGQSTLTVPELAGAPIELSPIQAAGADDVVRAATFDAASGTFAVPGRTTAAFIQPSQRSGPPDGIRSSPQAISQHLDVSETAAVLRTT